MLYLLFIGCSSKESESPLLQGLVDSNWNHTHEVKITYEDIKKDIQQYRTEENYGHYHQIILTTEEKEKLKLGLTLQKETELSAGHKHTITLQLLRF